MSGENLENLKNLPVLIVDVQATGPDPEKAHLIEIGWCVLRGASEPSFSVHSSFVRLDRGGRIPRNVTRITGITEEDLQGAPSPKEVWEQLLRSRPTASHPCPTVIHFARYEERFLRYLHELDSENESFPFRILCTHAVSSLLFPQLPRKGLRAVAGYLGFGTGERRRSTPHVEATARIWGALVVRLEESGVKTLSHLESWLKKSQAPSGIERRYPMAREKRERLPRSAGVYRMLRSNGDLLYVGKSKCLRSRIRTYFQPSARHPEHILEMLSQARELETTATPTALEAALLESEWIKDLDPPYNVALRAREDRRTVFASPDLKHFASRQDAKHPQGPFVGEVLLKSLACLVACLEKGPPPTTVHFPPPLDQSEDTRNAAIEIFRRRYAQKLQEAATLAACRKIGRVLWRRKEEAEPPGLSPESEQTPFGEEERAIEAAVECIEHLVRASDHLFRRARWFQVLQNAAICWKDVERGWHFLIFEGGELLKRGSSESRPSLDGRRPLQAASWTPHTYDRLRVLTTELKRLASEEREIAVELPHGHTLTHAPLHRLLFWL